MASKYTILRKTTWLLGDYKLLEWDFNASLPIMACQMESGAPCSCKLTLSDSVILNCLFCSVYTSNYELFSQYVQLMWRNGRIYKWKNLTVFFYLRLRITDRVTLAGRISFNNCAIYIEKCHSQTVDFFTPSIFSRVVNHSPSPLQPHH